MGQKFSKHSSGSFDEVTYHPHTSLPKRIHRGFYDTEAVKIPGGSTKRVARTSTAGSSSSYATAVTHKTGVWVRKDSLSPAASFSQDSSSDKMRTSDCSGFKDCLVLPNLGGASGDSSSSRLVGQYPLYEDGKLSRISTGSNFPDSESGLFRIGRSQSRSIGQTLRDKVDFAQASNILGLSEKAKGKRKAVLSNHEGSKMDTLVFEGGQFGPSNLANYGQNFLNPEIKRKPLPNHYRPRHETEEIPREQSSTSVQISGTAMATDDDFESKSANGDVVVEDIFQGLGSQGTRSQAKTPQPSISESLEEAKQTWLNWWTFKTSTMRTGRNLSSRSDPVEPEHCLDKNEKPGYIHARQLLKEETSSIEFSEDTRNFPKHEDCVVCGDTKPALSFPAKPPTANCKHPPATCEACLQEWVEMRINTNGWHSITCPQCPRKLSHAEVRLAASTATFTRYDDLTVRDALNSLHDFAWCINRGCGFGQENVDSGEGAIMICQKCRYRQCVRHAVKWHQGETCKQYEYRTTGKKRENEEAANLEYLKEEAVQCPEAKCGSFIQKTSGVSSLSLLLVPILLRHLSPLAPLSVAGASREISFWEEVEC